MAYGIVNLHVCGIGLNRAMNLDSINLSPAQRIKSGDILRDTRQSVVMKQLAGL